MNILLIGSGGREHALAWAIACGRAVVTSDARAFAEEISQGNGLSYPQGDVAALTQALHTLVAEPGRLQACTAAATQVAEARLWSRTGEAFAAYFQRLVQARASRPAPARATAPQRTASNVGAKPGRTNPSGSCWARLATPASSMAIGTMTLIRFTALPCCLWWCGYCIQNASVKCFTQM